MNSFISSEGGAIGTIYSNFEEIKLVLLEKRRKRDAVMIKHGAMEAELVLLKSTINEEVSNSMEMQRVLNAINISVAKKRKC